jgi:hypothetical protein
MVASFATPSLANGPPDWATRSWEEEENSLVMLAEVEYLCVHNVAANFQDCDSVTKGWCDFDVNMRIATGRNRFGAKQFTDLAIAVVTDLNSAVRFGNNQAEFNFCVALL